MDVRKDRERLAPFFRRGMEKGDGMNFDSLLWVCRSGVVIFFPFFGKRANGSQLRLSLSPLAIDATRCKYCSLHVVEVPCLFQNNGLHLHYFIFQHVVKFPCRTSTVWERYRSMLWFLMFFFVIVSIKDITWKRRNRSRATALANLIPPFQSNR